MAVIIFLGLVLIVVLVWAALAFLRGSKEIADTETDPAAGHQFPSERDDAPTLLEDDLSFANRRSDASRR